MITETMAELNAKLVRDQVHSDRELVTIFGITYREFMTAFNKLRQSDIYTPNITRTIFWTDKNDKIIRAFVIYDSNGGVGVRFDFFIDDDHYIIRCEIGSVQMIGGTLKFVESTASISSRLYGLQKITQPLTTFSHANVLRFH